MGHVVIAPDKFKGSLTAAEVAARVAAGLRRAAPGTATVELPVADGGDGTVDAAVAAGYQRVEAEVSGPTGQRVIASYALGDGTAVIEAAQACGLALLESLSRESLSGGKLAPLTASSRGVGELIVAAIDAGARRVVLGLGGVATNDGGAGLAEAFGARMLDDAGRELPPGGGALGQLKTLDLSGLRDLSGVEFQVASDVDNPLLGASGAAAVYGPQKGATPNDVAVLDAALARWADVAEDAMGGRRSLSPVSGAAPAADSGHTGVANSGHTAQADSGHTAQADSGHAAQADSGHAAAGARTRDLPGAGAAGGLGFAALLFLRATLRPGIELLLDMLGFAAHLDGAGLVITGEGALDEQTLRGKAPAGVARAAAAYQPPVPVVTVSGICSLTEAALSEAGIAAAYTLSSLEPDVRRSIANAGPLTEELATRIAARWLRP